MPTYEYRCTSCNHHYEKREGFDAPSLQECPNCGAQARRVIHPPPIVFKASGFYVTDNRRPSPVGSASSEVESVTAATDGGNGSKESEKKPAAGDKATEPAAAG